MKFAQAVKDTWKQYKFVWSQVSIRGDILDPIKKVFGGLVEFLDGSFSIVLAVLCLPLFPVGVIVRMYKGWKNK